MSEPVRAPAPPSDTGATHDVTDGTVRLHAAHRDETTALQATLDRITAWVGWPGFTIAVAAATGVWIGANLLARHYGINPIDPPPFSGLQVTLSVGALLVVTLILSTQRREDKLASHRALMILELAILNDQKNSKIIALIEEERRDNPAIPDRLDGQAITMSTPADPVAVLEAIKEVPVDPA